MSILLVGASGNMGKRYQAVLRHLEQDYKPVDIETRPAQLLEYASKSDGVIIATPTETHESLIRLLLSSKRPILCEKPLSKDIKRLRDVLAEVREAKANLTMICQYKMLVDGGSSGMSLYDYFRHGNDGLIWDCIQIIGLAKGPVQIKEQSPIWKCWINGQKLSLADMDRAYVEYIRRWISKPGQDLGEIQDFHEKTHALAEGKK